tara:strand:- start:5531 stop:6109 length:579 start_codon:yes stop_codon:yes gene_type:complete
MVYGDLQFFDILIFAGIAIFLIYRLRSVLGKRTSQESPVGKNHNIKETKQIIKKTPQLKDNEQKLLVIYEKVEGFDHKMFFDGAKKAFEIIITAFNQGDKKTLKPLVSKNVYEIFEKAINEKQNDPTLQFYSLVIDGVESASFNSNTMQITVKFFSEQLKNNDENSIIKKQDAWTFEKKINSNSPIWVLTST